MMFYCILTPCYCILNCIRNNQGAQATQGEQVALFVPTSSAALGIAFKGKLDALLSLARTVRARSTC